MAGTARRGSDAKFDWSCVHQAGVLLGMPRLHQCDVLPLLAQLRGQACQPDSSGLHKHMQKGHNTPTGDALMPDYAD